MTLKDLVVHVDTGSQSEARLDAAVGLAARHEAHLIGLYVTVQPHLPNYVRSLMTEDILARQQAMLRQAAERAEAQFKARTARNGVRAEWRVVEGHTEPAIALHGRYCDVVVVGQRDPEGDEAGAEPGMPDRLILSVGRPVLVIPSAGTFPDIGKRVMVAWDGSRLATRAVNDALPLLERADQVSVIAVNPTAVEHQHGEIPSADICLHLARHGIKAEAQHVYADDIEIGDMLLSRAADQGIDLLVMGAYGHARWRELVLGGTTRHLLDHMTVPVLMSH